ncbi:uncharacterized protein METZ01_LOCUS451150, partial [marine metagenome]
MQKSLWYKIVPGFGLCHRTFPEPSVLISKPAPVIMLIAFFKLLPLTSGT